MLHRPNALAGRPKSRARSPVRSTSDAKDALESRLHKTSMHPSVVPSTLRNLKERVQFYLCSSEGAPEETEGTDDSPAAGSGVHRQVPFPAGWTSVDSAADDRVYAAPLRAVLVRAGLEGYPAGLAAGDLAHRCAGQVVKNRCPGSRVGTVVKCMEKRRHWQEAMQRGSWAADDPPLAAKKGIAFWRGTTTGRPEWEASRFALVRRWHGRSPLVDVGFSDVCQGKDEMSGFVKGKMDWKEMLQYRYILSVRGNDKDSGLNWKLSSNSVVLMHPPENTSWLMEPLLKPWVHYVPLRPDFEDVEDKVKWCEANLGMCEQISYNARRYMAMFRNEALEAEVENAVLRAHVAKFSGP